MPRPFYNGFIEHKYRNKDTYEKQGLLNFFFLHVVSSFVMLQTLLLSTHRGETVRDYQLNYTVVPIWYYGSLNQFIRRPTTNFHNKNLVQS